MAGIHPRHHQARKSTLDADRHLRYRGGRWKLYQYVQVANSPSESNAWYPQPIGPQLARELMDQAGIDGGEK